MGKKAGRPIIGKTPRNKVMRMRVTAAEYRAISKAAKAKGQSMTAVLVESFKKGQK